MNLKILATISGLAAAALFASGLPAEAARAVIVGNTSLRTGPGSDYRVIGRLRSGERVNVTTCARSRRWCHVQPRRLHSGWVASRSLDRVKGSGPSRPGRGICFFGSRGEICLNH